MVDDKEMRRAWKHCVFTAPPIELDIRLKSLAAQLDATIGEAKGVLRRAPVIATLQPARVGLHVTQLRDLGFSHSQVKSLCLRQPNLLTLSYSSQVQAAKWAFLTSVLQLSPDDLAAKPHLLMLSLPNRLGPRWEYLQQLALHGVLASADAHYLGSLPHTDTRFRASILYRN